MVLCSLRSPSPPTSGGGGDHGRFAWNFARLERTLDLAMIEGAASTTRDSIIHPFLGATFAAAAGSLSPLKETPVYLSVSPSHEDGIHHHHQDVLLFHPSSRHCAEISTEAAAVAYRSRENPRRFSARTTCGGDGKSE